MNNHQYYYRRTEERYILKKDSLAAVAEAAGRLTPAGSREMIRIYYDTDDYSLASAALSGAGTQESLSIQSEGVPDAGSDVRLLLRKRAGDFFMENATSMTYAEAQKVLTEEECSGCSGGRSVSEEARELGFDVNSLFGFYRGLLPRCAVSYSSEEFTAGCSQHLKVSVLSDPRIRMTHLSLGFGNAGDPMLDHDQVMLILTSDRAIPDEVTAAVAEEGGTELRFSDLGCVYAGAVVSGATSAGRLSGSSLRSA
jgi:hypothetical protein